MMRNWKRFLVLGLTLALSLSLSGCMADPNVDAPPPGSDATPETVSPESSAPPISFADHGMRIALCTSPDSVNDRAHNAASYEGILNFIISRNIIDNITPSQQTGGSADAALLFLQSAVSYYDTFVCVGPAYRKIATVAKENPTKYFILVDAVPDEEADNLHAVTYAEEQCGFFAGIAAAMETRTGRVAVVNDLPTEANIHYYYGFRSGVAYTNGNFGTTAEVIDLPEYAGNNGLNLGGNFTRNTGDQSTVYTMAKELIAQDCDILFVAAGAAGAGAYAAAGEHEDVWIIGSESDQFTHGESGERNLVLTSVIKNIPQEIESLLTSIADGTFQGGSYRLTSADNALGYVFATDHQQLGEKTLKILADSYPMMQDGTIVPGTGPQ